MPGKRSLYNKVAVLWGLTRVAVIISLGAACGKEASFDAEDPGRGPGQWVGLDAPLNEGPLPGGDDVIPAPRNVPPPLDDELPNCDAECVSYCNAANLQNPIHRGMCLSTWGVGLNTMPVVTEQSCRRLFVDLTGHFPSRAEIEDRCLNRPWSEVVWELLETEEFARMCRMQWADVFRYSTQSVSLERIYDFDEMATKLCTGYLAYDAFAAAASSHQVLTRRYATPADRAEALVTTFWGRPPFENERADFARLYNLWSSDYYDHPFLNMRLPDAFVEYQCVNEDGKADAVTQGECTSILYGHNPVVLEPDIRAHNSDGTLRMWSGLIKAEEWQLLQTPGKILSQETLFWEHASDQVTKHYLGYDLSRETPAVRTELVRYFLTYGGDLRALHYAVATSVAYLQSTEGLTPTTHRWTFGPLKQVQAEGWMDSIEQHLGIDVGACDLRLTRPQDFLDSGSIAAFALVENSDWPLNENPEDEDDVLRTDYRNLVRTIGGCPSNEPSGRFKIVSVLTTGVQVGFATEVCDPGALGESYAAPITSLLPSGVDPTSALTLDSSRTMLDHQAGLLLGRTPLQEEIDEVLAGADECVRQNCNAEEFARPLCYALLSSAEMLFY